jgi:hypothetical protein
LAAGFANANNRPTNYPANTRRCGPRGITPISREYQRIVLVFIDDASKKALSLRLLAIPIVHAARSKISLQESGLAIRPHSFAAAYNL